MNINKELVARAMNKAGEEPLTEEDYTNKGTRYRLVKDYYLATILETLAATSWTSQLKAIKLEIEEENESAYMASYKLPIDCAKPVRLKSEEEFSVAGKILYTDDTDAVLIYVTNEYTGELKYNYEEAEPQPTAETFSQNEYFTYNEETETYETADQYNEHVTYYVREQIEEDYELYNDIDLQSDPLLSELIETRLAAKIVLKLTGKTDLYTLLYNESQIMEQRAVKASFAHAHSKNNGNSWWSDILGLPDYEGGM